MLGDDIVVQVMEIVGSSVRIGIEAPRSRRSTARRSGTPSAKRTGPPPRRRRTRPARRRTAA